MRKPPLTGAPGGLLKAKNVRAIQGETVKSDFTPTVVFFADACRWRIPLTAPQTPQPQKDGSHATTSHSTFDHTNHEPPRDSHQLCT